MIKLTNTPILPNCQVPNDFFRISVNSSLQYLKNVFNFRPNAGAEPGVFRICISNEAGFLLKIHIYKVEEAQDTGILKFFSYHDNKAGFYEHVSICNNSFRKSIF